MDNDKKLIACSPNISEGQDIKIIKKILTPVEKNKNLKLLLVHSFKDFNRTKVLFIGPPRDVHEAAVDIVKRAAEILNIEEHEGDHPCIGAVDVLPFIPLKNMNMKECVEIARNVAKDIGKKLKVPVFLYGNASKRDDFKNLSSVRDHEYEGLKALFDSGEIEPDFGPKQMDKRSGAIAVGARSFVSNLKFTINTNNGDIADQVAKKIRESGVEMQDGTHVPGKLKSVKAAGFKTPAFDKAFILMALTDHNLTPLHVAYIDTRKALENLNYDIEATEIQGFVLRKHLLDAGRYFMKIRNKSLSEENEIISYALDEMRIHNFNLKKKMLDF